MEKISVVLYVIGSIGNHSQIKLNHSLSSLRGNRIFELIAFN